MDFIVLNVINTLLKNNASINRIIIGSITGLFSILVFFIRFNSIIVLLFKFSLSLLIIIISFGKYKIIKNTLYYYIISIFLSGLLYFIKNNITSNILYILSVMIVIPIIIYIIILEIINIKNNYKKIYKVKITIDDKEYTFNAFLDTGNKLFDPVFHYPVILVNLKTKFNENYIYVPYNTLSGRGILKCIKKSNITINGIDIKKNYLIGLTDNIKIKDIDCILNERILEG